MKKTRSYSKKAASKKSSAKRSTKKTTATTGSGNAYSIQKAKRGKLRGIMGEIKKGRK